MKHRIVHSDWNCEDCFVCLSLLSESAIWYIWQGWCRQIIGGNSLTAAIGCVWLEQEHTVSEVLSWQVQLKKAPVLFCTAVKHLTVPHESWVPRSADTTLLNHSTVRGYLYWPTDHYTQETGPRSSKSGCRGLTHSDGYDFSAKHCTLFNFVPLSLCLF